MSDERNKNAEPDNAQASATATVRLALPEMRGEKILYTYQPLEGEDEKLRDDIADAYVVVEEPQARNGIIVYGLYYGDKWIANPWNVRPLIKQLLKDLRRA